ncbi:Protein C44C1.2 [Aphelenchoides avenae]|nr:Protein C44C1.2 [Aphelenchus avenae]
MRLRWQFMALVALLCGAALTEATLSKSDRSKTKKQEAPPARKQPQKPKEPVKKKPAAATEVDDEETDEDEASLKQEILKAAHKLHTKSRKFTAPVTLGYVTPWNNHGYDVAKWAARKFTHIAPVWFQLRGADVDGQVTCTISGTHDIDHGWMEDIRANNSDAKIVPRFLFEQWSADELKSLMMEEPTQLRCGQAIVEFLQRNEMDGAVMEIWLQIMSMTRGQAGEYLLEMVEAWGKQFRRAGLEFFLPMSPPLSPTLEEIGIVSRQILPRLSVAVDYINVMTYDFPSNEIAGVAPLPWVEANLRHLIDAGVDPTKVLLGLNWYGYDRSGGRMDAILGKRFFEQLSQPYTELEWDDEAKEHRIRWSDNGIAYFPTLKSIGYRLKLADQLGIGGVGVWELGQGLDYFTAVL